MTTFKISELVTSDSDSIFLWFDIRSLVSGRLSKVILSCSGRSDKIVLEKFAELARFTLGQRIQIRGVGKGNQGVDYLLKTLPEIAKTASRTFQKMVIALDTSELREKNRHNFRRDWIAKAADAVPQGMTLCIVYMDAYLEEVMRACLLPESQDEFERER